MCIYILEILFSFQEATLINYICTQPIHAGFEGEDYFRKLNLLHQELEDINFKKLHEGDLVKASRSG